MLNINTQVIEIPEPMFRGWQQTLNLIADSIAVPAVFIMRVHHNDIEIYVANDNQVEYVGQLQQSTELQQHCQQVINQQSSLLITEPNPVSGDNSLVIGSYFGLPLNWPNQQVFGALCFIDHKVNPLTPQHKSFILLFQQALQADLDLLYQKAELAHCNMQLKEQLAKQNVALAVTKQNLLYELDSRRALESRLIYQQHYDALTGLANQSSLISQVDAMLTHVDDNNELAIIYLGLRNFRSINNSYGYTIGDKILLQISQRIHQQLTTEYLIGRCWGDAFAIVVRDENVVEQTIDLVSRLSQSFDAKFQLDGFVITVPVCFGIALADSANDKAISLLEKSEAAMSVSKEQSKYYSFFDQDIEAVACERHYLESHLAEALNNNEMTVHYQPMVSVKSGRVMAAEALVRWTNPVLGAVSPERFIYLAEQNGQILAIGNFVLRTAIKQAAEFRHQFGDDFCIAVNMSPVQFRDDNLVIHVAELLAYYRLPPGCLELEITEGVLLQDELKAGIAIDALQKLGVLVSLDDFGTGYASLSYLQKYSFDTLKIDRSFIQNVTKCEEDRELARAIIAMAKKLHLYVVAEGVETAEQNQFIIDEGCDFGQGYLFGKPVPAKLFAGLYGNLDAG